MPGTHREFKSNPEPVLSILSNGNYVYTDFIKTDVIESQYSINHFPINPNRNFSHLSFSRVYYFLNIGYTASKICIINGIKGRHFAKKHFIIFELPHLRLLNLVNNI